MVQLTSLTSIVDLAEINGEMLLAARIRNHVRLVSLKPGNLQIALAGAAPDQLAGDIARFLSQWTGQRWLVSLSEFGGEETLANISAKVMKNCVIQSLVSLLLHAYWTYFLGQVLMKLKPQRLQPHTSQLAVMMRY